MKKIMINLGMLTCFIILLSGCTKQKVGPLADLRPPVPVTVQNAVDFRLEPTVSTSKAAGGAIQIVLSIPSNSGLTIKEISKVAVGTTYTQIQSTATTGFYTTTPIPGNGTSVTFTTSLAEYVAKGPGTIPASNTELAKRFYFLLTLSDGSIVIPESVRVLVLD